MIAAVVKSPVKTAQIHYGGYSASANFLLTLDDGRKIFAKGNHPGEQAHGVQTLRQEIKIYETAPILRDISPRYLGQISDGDEDGWALGLWDYLPHTRPSTDQAIDTLRRWQSADVQLEDARAKNYIRDFFNVDKKWRRLSEDNVRNNFLGLFDDVDAARLWLDKNLPALLAEQNKITGPLGPEGPLHGDFRADNTLLSDGRAYIVDWPNACHGPLVFDHLFLDPANTKTDAAAITMAAVLAGHFAVHAGRAIPDKLPRLRWMQKTTLLGLLRFLERAEIVESVPRMRDQLI